MESKNRYNDPRNRPLPRGSHNRMRFRRQAGVMLQGDFFPTELDLYSAAEKLRRKLFKSNEALKGYWLELDAQDRILVMLELRRVVLAARFGEATPDWVPAVWLYSVMRGTHNEYRLQ